MRTIQAYYQARGREPTDAELETLAARPLVARLLRRVPCALCIFQTHQILYPRQRFRLEALGTHWSRWKGSEAGPTVDIQMQSSTEGLEGAETAFAGEV